MRALLCDPAPVKNHDTICLFDGIQTMGNGQYGTADR
jgi:hypothetical protein